MNGMHGSELLWPWLATWLGLGRAPMPSWTRLRSKPLQWAERSSPGPGLCQQLETGPPSFTTQPRGRRAKRGAPRGGPLGGVSSFRRTRGPEED
eukprot:8110505-Alexandrium_andersonii.AAC.1